MGEKTGRKRKYPSEAKITLINRFFIEFPTSDTMQTHGIFKKLSDYAKALNIELEPYDFSKDKSVRAYIDAKIAGRVIAEDTGAIPTYQPLDITVLMAGGRKIIEETLVSRERYFEGLHKKAAMALEDYVSLSKRCEYLQKELEEKNIRCRQLTEENDELNKQLSSARKENTYLKRIIRKDVEPNRAQHFLEGLTSREAVVDVVRDSVTQKMEVLTMDDRKMHSTEECDTDYSDLNILFKS